MAALLLELPPPPFFICNHHRFLSSSKTTLHYFPSKIPPPLTFTPTTTRCFLPTVTSSSIPEEEEEEEEEPRSIAVASTNAPDESPQQDRRKVVQIAWEKLVRWSRSWRSKNSKTDHLERTNKVVVLGGGSFGTAMAAHVAYRKSNLEVQILLRDPLLCQSINENHCNCKYFPEHKLPDNVIATTNAKAALLGADYCFHAVPVQFSSSFLEGIAEYVDPGLPFISLSKGLELNTLRMMSQIIPQALGNPYQPFVSLSGPSFALELMNKLPTAMVVASKDKKLAHATQQLLASSLLRISTSRDVTGVEIAGALKNVLAIAAGIVEGMNLGNNSMAALVAQGCTEIRWLATKIWVVSPVLYLTISSPLLILKMGAKPATITGLSGTGDIMLTCFVNLSRNRTVGVRLGSGEKLDDILGSMNQVAEGVSTAGAVIALAQKYNVKMPVLTAVARIIDNELTPKKAVLELMSLPQVEEV
ncbi:GLYCEROL-3-PHOSPHATE DEHYDROGENASE [Salix koriyanagi]|uniref:Glycerol-3-phosphate dehydrogenase [NAD(+)] n=1 Tax=Salix koriyanagi TaxID=2511006 RepID=A0A9Q1A4K9_9ROSI|nr:GLYCEROL-3-PHOSPHATE DEHYDROGENASE [Salix koriyanagi]